MQRTQTAKIYARALSDLGSKRFENKNIAVRNLDILSSLGHAEAKFQLGMVYEEKNTDFKEVVNQSDIIAFEYYHQASGSGHAEASFKLGIMNSLELAEQKSDKKFQIECFNRSLVQKPDWQLAIRALASLDKHEMTKQNCINRIESFRKGW